MKYVNTENAPSDVGGRTSGFQLLLVLPLPFCRDADRLLVEKQAGNGLRLWLKHFSTVCLAAPVLEDSRERLAQQSYVPLEQLALDGLTCVPLPWAYHPRVYLATYRGTRRRLGELIRQSKYLQFAVGGCDFGDWAAVASREAHRQQRQYSVHTDAVSYRLTQKASQNSRGLKRLKHRIQTVFQKHKSYEVISGAALGLFHGADCYEEFRSLPQVAELIHDVHCGPEMLIPTAQVVKKTDTLVAGRHLRIGYCGRAIEIKGPIEWMEVCRRLYSDGVSFSAKWIGDGEHLCEMRQYRSKHRLEEVIELPGFMGDRANVMHEMRKFDLLLFCHRVAESPRVLIEALMSGTPIVGYTSPYARDLTCGGGGLLVEIGDVKGLADCVMRLTNDRRALADLITNAAEVGRGFSDEAVFAHRASLIRKHLPA